MAEHQNIRFLVCFLGIFGCYFFYGLLQERITRGNYGSKEDGNEERFTYIMSMIFCQCVVNYIYAILLSRYVLQQSEDNTKSSYYALSSLTYLVAMISSNKALTWVNYPTQVVGKSCKPIPVMILNVLVGRKSYPFLKYFFVLAIVIGVSLFIYKDKPATTTDDGHLLGLGELLLLCSLTCDGLTGAVQERMKSEHGTKSGPMMKNMNLWSILYLGIMLTFTGEIYQFLGFVHRHPQVLWQLATLAIASALGQFFIFMCVADFGTLPCSIITTTRKFFTVLGSVIIFGNTLSNRQWLGTSLVFTGLILDSMYGKPKPRSIKD